MVTVEETRQQIETQRQEALSQRQPSVTYSQAQLRQGGLTALQQRQQMQSQQIQAGQQQQQYLTELEKQKADYELQVAKYSPSQALPEYKQQAYQEATSKIQEQVNAIQRRIDESEKNLQRYVAGGGKDTEMQENRISELRAEQRGYAKALGGSEEDVIRNYYSGNTQSMADIAQAQREQLTQNKMQPQQPIQEGGYYYDNKTGQGYSFLGKAPEGYVQTATLAEVRSGNVSQVQQVPDIFFGKETLKNIQFTQPEPLPQIAKPSIDFMAMANDRQQSIIPPAETTWIGRNVMPKIKEFEQKTIFNENLAGVGIGGFNLFTFREIKTKAETSPYLAVRAGSQFIPTTPIGVAGTIAFGFGISKAPKVIQVGTDVLFGSIGGYQVVSGKTTEEKLGGGLMIGGATLGLLTTLKPKLKVPEWTDFYGGEKFKTKIKMLDVFQKLDKPSYTKSQLILSLKRYAKNPILDKPTKITNEPFIRKYTDKQVVKSFLEAQKEYYYQNPKEFSLKTDNILNVPEVRQIALEKANILSKQKPVEIKINPNEVLYPLFQQRARLKSGADVLRLDKGEWKIVSSEVPKTIKKQEPYFTFDIIKEKPKVEPKAKPDIFKPLETKTGSQTLVLEKPQILEQPKIILKQEQIFKPKLKTTTEWFYPMESKQVSTFDSLFKGKSSLQILTLPQQETKQSLKMPSILISPRLSQQEVQVLNIKQISKQQPKVKQVERVIPLFKPTTKQIPILKPISVPKPIERQLEKQISKQITKQTEKLIPRLKIPPKIFIPTSQTSKLKVQDIFEDTSEGYKTFVMKGGKKQYLSGVLPKGEAIKRGELVTTKTLRATFGVEKAGVKVRERGLEYKPDPRIFRGYKIKGEQRIPLQDVWIQKAGTIKEPTIKGARLGSRGEKLEILSAKRSKSSGRFRWV